MRNIIKLFLFFALFLVGMQGNAQNVTIGPDNGSLISGIAGGNVDDSGKGRGMASMWRHEQLGLTMTTSDIANLTSAGELADPSCAIGKYDADGDGKKELFIGAGQTQTFIVVSLPKGYRIKGYRLVLQPNMYGNNVVINQGYNSWDIGDDDLMRFYETDPWSIGYPYTSGTTGNNSNTHCTLYDLDQYGYSYKAVAHTIDDSEVNGSKTLMMNNNETNRSKEYVIERYSQNETDMTNQLHFVIVRGASQYAVTIKSFNILFTAEGTFTADVTPAVRGGATDYVTSPFTTSKMDVGAVQMDEASGLYAYDFKGVRDLIAYAHLYQHDAVSGGKPANVATEKNIRPAQINGEGGFVFGNDMYYIEPPTTIHTASGWESPIGFRVIGATFEYKWQNDTIPGEQITLANTCYIRGYTPDNRNGYLNDQLDFGNSQFAWQIDDFKNIYREYSTTNGDGTTTTYRKYLACYGTGDEREISLSSSATGDEARWNLRLEETGDRRVYYKSDGGNYYYLNYRVRQEGSTDHSRGFVRLQGSTGWNSNLATNSTNGSHTITTDSIFPGSYILKIYGTEKSLTAEPVKTIKVDSSNAEGSYHLTGLNNDAVRFEIDSLATGKQAILHVKLELQSLNPYINSMDVVCEDTPKELQLTQTFNANDFRVSGGKFIFYVPDEYKDSLMTISFKNLFSDYGDSTYYNGKTGGNSRYSFVTSPYFEQVSDLYAASYNPNADYENKVITSVAGNVRFKFNNAEDLTTGEDASNLVEYAFEPYKTYDEEDEIGGYQGYPDPDYKATDDSLKHGRFIDCKLKATDEDMKAGTFFVFTADETRFNIAPTTAMQHRMYAFYRMDIELVAKEYYPLLTWEKIYDKTCYYSGEDEFPDTDNNASPEGSPSTKSMWGVKVTTTETVDNKYGYLTYHGVMDKIAHDIDSLKTLGLDSIDQILYVDGSKLHSLVNSQITKEVNGTTQVTKVTLDSLKAVLAKNALIFLPESNTSTLDNVVYIKDGAFRAGKDIVLTDRYPFFTPYDIQVISPNKSTYTRTITTADYGKDIMASVMLPFTLTVVDGVHTNPDGSHYSLWEMKSADLTLEMQKLHDYYGQSYFQKVDGEYTSAHVPYLINLDSLGTQGEEYSFIAAQTGGKIFATDTTLMKTRTVSSSGYNQGKYKYLYIGTPVSAAVDIPGGSMSLTLEGSYSGQIYDRAESEAIFYFSNNKFLNLYTLIGTKRFLYMYPFRGVYSFDGSFSSVNSIFGLDISFDDPGNLDAIRDITKAYVPDLAVRSGKGFIEMTSAKDQTVNVISLNGTSYSRVNMNAGDSKTVALPAGVYVVNNVKIIVK